mgnify:CR=1 FL=1
MEPVRAELVVLNTSRDAARGKGSWGVNGYAEELKSGLRASKRPGLEAVALALGTPGQGLFSYNDTTVAVYDDLLVVTTGTIIVELFNLETGKSLLWKSGTSYGLGEQVFVVDETTGDLVSYYSASYVPSPTSTYTRSKPGTAGWRGLDWSTTPTGTTATYTASGRGLNLSGTTPELSVSFGTTIDAAWSACVAGCRLYDTDGVNVQYYSEPYQTRQLMTYAGALNGPVFPVGYSGICTTNPYP